MHSGAATRRAAVAEKRAQDDMQPFPECMAQYSTERQSTTHPPPCARAAPGAPRFSADLTATHPPCMVKSGILISSETHPLGKTYNPGAR